MVVLVVLVVLVMSVNSSTSSNSSNIRAQLAVVVKVAEMGKKEIVVRSSWKQLPVTILLGAKRSMLAMVVLLLLPQR